MENADKSFEGQDRSKKSPRKFWILLKTLLSAGVLAALIWRFKSDLPSLATIDVLSTLAAVALLLFQPMLIGVRWWLLLRQYDSKIGMGTLTLVTWVSVFANQFLPAGVGGDAVRVLYATRLGGGLGPATASVLMDRIMALVALVILILIFAAQLPQAVDFRIIEVLGVLCCAGLVMLGAIYAYVRRAGHERHSPFVQRILTLVVFVLRSIERPRATAAAILISIVIHILSFSAFFIIVRGLSIEVSVPSFIAIAALLTFIQTMPISIGGWGVREIAAISLLGMLGVAGGPALLASLLLGMCYAAASLPGAVIWPFMRDRVTPSDRS